MNSEVLGRREWTSLVSHHTPQRSSFPLLRYSTLKLIKQRVPWHHCCKDELDTHTHTEVLRNPELNLYIDRKLLIWDNN